MREHMLIVVLVLGVFLIGCSNQSGDASVPVETTQVNMPASYRFDPPVIQVETGATVTWRNSDNFTHSVSILEQDLPFLNLPPGEAGTITFEQPGEYAYICTYHPQDMKGKVIVSAP